MQARSSLLVLVALFLAGPPALAKRKSAEDQPTARETSRDARVRQARKACLEGDYVKGVALLSDLFLDFKDPDYIYNQARCYEQNERFEEAISRFREYLRAGGEGQSDTEKHIAECETLMHKKTLSAGAPVTVSVPQPAAPSPVPAIEPAAVVEIVQPEAHSTSSGSGLRIAGVAILGVASAAGVTGLLLNLKANSLAKGIEPPNTYDRNAESTRKSYESFSLASYAVGGAAVVTGAILYWIGWRRGRLASDVVVVPTVGPEFAGAMMESAF